MATPLKMQSQMLDIRIVCTALLLFATSCGGGKSKPSAISRASTAAVGDYCPETCDYSYDDAEYDLYGDETSTCDLGSDDVAVVPYREECGVKIVEVRVNGIPMDMIFDTGCSGTLISLAEANYLADKGLLAEEDFIGTASSVIADGSVVENTMIILRHVEVGGAVYCDDVVATVSPNVDAPLLMGNEILDRVKSFTVDNVDKNIILYLY